MEWKNSSSEKQRQAVFLSNGQVYFGYVVKADKQTVRLEDIYYLQVQQNLQQPAQDKESKDEPQINLVKLGSELHGPVDHMRINRDHVLFIEDMKQDSKVNQAIEDYIKNGSRSTATPPDANL